MAKFLSQVYTQIRGSVGGITYLTTPAGAMIARARVIPVNAPSPARTIVKSAMTTGIAYWGALTTAQRDAWNLWALANGPGDGRHQFIAAQALQAQGDISGMSGWPALMTVNTAAPALTGHPSSTWTATPFVTPLSTGVAFKFRNTSAYAVCAIFEIGPGLSEMRNYWKGPFDAATWKAEEVAAGGTKTVTFAGLEAGKRYFGRVRSFSFSVAVGYTGRVVSPRLITWAKAVTNP